MGKPIRAYSAVRLQAKELRHKSTQAEELLWQKIKNRQLAGFKFRRQSPMGTFIADFYCAECKLVIELDGQIHNRKAKYDKIRIEIMETVGYHVLRFNNDMVNNDLNNVLDAIQRTCSELSLKKIDQK